jgi:hypothetical protein
LLRAWPVLAALWGMLIFGELRGSEGTVKIMRVLMLAMFLCGVVMMSLVPVQVVAQR